ncbi:MAG: hypothetical protein AB7I27_16145 [Bacteriovoracaceae bacterium]
MKFFISLLLPLSAMASPIHLYYEQNIDHALTIKEILVKNYHIPEELIALKEAEECEKLAIRGKFELCSKNNGDLFVVSVDREFVNESLKVFQAP